MESRGVQGGSAPRSPAGPIFFFGDQFLRILQRPDAKKLASFFRNRKSIFNKLKMNYAKNKLKMNYAKNFCLFLVYVAVVHTTPPTTPARTTEKRGHRWEYWVRACIALATHPGAMYFQARTRIPDRCQWSSNVRWGSLTEALTHFHARCRFWHRSDQKLCLP